MTSVTIDVPLMYADHHVVEVRRILFEVPGVNELDASSAFQAVKIEYDPEKTSEDILKQVLDKNGYLDLEELRKIKEEMVYDPADRNDDGKLTMSEYIDQRFEVFHDADTNSDGLLSLQEVIQAYASP